MITQKTFELEDNLMKTPGISRLMIAGLSIALLAATPAFAKADGSNTYINGAVGIEDFDNDRQLNSKDLISLGLEHRYNQNWGVEIFYMDSSPKVKASGENLDLTQYGFDGLYYFDTDAESNVQPYGAFGLGISKFDGNNNSNDEAQARVGLGLRYLLNDHWSVKGDTRLLWSEESHTVDNTLTVGISYAFEPQRSKKPMTVVAVEKDSDNDGVMDSSDQCPTTPAGVGVNSKGCALDSDGDGVANYQDNCPDTSAYVVVDSKGCPLDRDGDGVADHKDQCPDTAKGASVDTKGCMLDSDADGVGDHLDQCPTTPAGRPVDAKGCKYVLTRTEEMTLKINFASNSNNVTEDQYKEIDKVATFLRKYSGVNTVIEGHTDDRGSADYNQKLSQSRANAVRNVLIERYGIASSRVTATGFGESRPIQTNDTNEGRLANRRVVAVMKAQVSE